MRLPRHHRPASTRRPHRPMLLAALVTALTLIGSGAAVSFAQSASASTLPHVDTSGFPHGARLGIFTDRCHFTHRAAQDPILMPGKTGMSMEHDFFGNSTVSASSTGRSLVGHGSRCSTSADASAYWIPTLYQNGHPLTVRSELSYWREPFRGATRTVAPPTGLQMIAGNEHATHPQPMSVLRWTCRGPNGPGKATSRPHSCGSHGGVKLTIDFPDCWDGHTLSGAKQTNVVYADRRTGCPRSHPVAIPQLVFHVVYPTHSGSGLTLSVGAMSDHGRSMSGSMPAMSGSTTRRGSTDTAHADFINAWNPRLFAADVHACVASATRCGGVSGSHATPHGPRTKPKH